MSWETQSWAAKQRPGSASAKLVLLGLASCTDANHCAYPSIDWLCEFSDLNRKTVIAALQRLEEGPCALIADTGERKGKTKQVKVYRLAANSHYRASGLHTDPKSETVPKAEPSQKRNSSGFSSKQSQKRDTEPFREPIPPSDPNGSEAPTAEIEDDQDQEIGAAGDNEQGEEPPAPPPPPVPAKAHRLPDGWTPPPIGDLGEKSSALAALWPDGAYATVAEQFAMHWKGANGPTARKLDWGAAWAKWVITEHDKIMRAAKAGTSFAPAPKTPAAAPRKSEPVAAKVREDERSAGFHAVLERDLGARVYARWLKPAAILFERGAITIVVSTDFQRADIETNLLPGIMVALARWNAPVSVVTEAKHSLPNVRSPEA